jgi:hypothetical protein
VSEEGILVILVILQILVQTVFFAGPLFMPEEEKV